MKISVGSKNPIKISAVENAVKKIWPGAEVVSAEVNHGTSEQPMSDEEAIQGAANRAKLSLEKFSADIGIGLEGCVNDTKHGMFLSGWVAAIDKNGEIGIGGGGGLLLPEKIASEIRKGKELGPVMDKFIGGHNTKQKQGTVGILTNNLIPRTEAFEKSVIYALAKFINPHYYK